MKNMIWYNNLNKPLLNPPAEIFAPVWTVLYIMIFISLFLFLKGGMNKSKILPLIFFIIQLILNFSWSGVFFGLKNINAALIIIAFMWLFILLTVLTFKKHSKAASWMLVPYLLWVSFAFYLNFEYTRLN